MGRCLRYSISGRIKQGGVKGLGLGEFLECSALLARFLSLTLYICFGRTGGNGGLIIRFPRFWIWTTPVFVSFSHLISQHLHGWHLFHSVSWTGAAEIPLCARTCLSVSVLVGGGLGTGVGGRKGGCGYLMRGFPFFFFFFFFAAAAACLPCCSMWKLCQISFCLLPALALHDFAITYLRYFLF